MKIHRSLFGGGGNAIENRKLLNFWARFVISVANAVTFLAVLWLLFYSEVARMTADPNITSIPADKNQVVLDADIESAKEKEDKFQEELANKST